MTTKGKITRKITNALIFASLLTGSMAIVNSKPVQAKQCGVGYTLNASGLCVNITTQRPVVSKASKRATAYALCLTTINNWTYNKQQACMRAKGYK